MAVEDRRAIDQAIRERGDTLTLDSYYEDPVGFNDNVLRRPPLTPDQARIVEAVVDHKIVVVPTGNSVGKTYALAGLILWWLYTRPGSLVVATAPSQTLLGSVLFKEIRRAKMNPAVPLPGTLTESPRAAPQMLQVDAFGWGVLGIATRGVERLSGQHNPELLVVVDEASGVEDEIWEALDSQNPKRMVVCGNPIRAEGRFRELAARADRESVDPTIPPGDRVYEIRIPSTSSPDIHLDRSPRGLADKGFLDASRRQYGADGLWWRTHIAALFPEVSSDALIPEPWLDWATRPEHQVRLVANDARGGYRRIACDLGEGVGRDRTVVLVRDDLQVLEVSASRTDGLPEAALLIKRMAIKWNVEHNRIVYDCMGVGKSLANHLQRVGIIGARGYAGSGRPRERGSFANLRSESAWRMRNRLDPNWCPDPHRPTVRQPSFYIPPADWWPQMREELKTLSYDFLGKTTRLVPKEEHADRLGRSPDLADALMMSFSGLPS